ncbi:MAG: hypothetical protein M4579_005880 [Chaenotheca gracillima]|nr:MAG: hypothetical protein M4579_005880 [Chaenotheca gracillima]
MSTNWDEHGEDEHDVRSVRIGNIPFKIGWQDLKDLVKGVLKNDKLIEYIEIRTGSDQRSRGDGWVYVKGAAAARTVYEELNGYEWNHKRGKRKLEVWLKPAHLQKHEVCRPSAVRLQ